ncbi:MAG: hypothetical protein QOH62_3206 [Solirubrobacteraceae bacterium]|jgi:hypothetical protein|nr:hypothetical protein [Solirubrobacteraceae bacterium]
MAEQRRKTQSSSTNGAKSRSGISGREAVARARKELEEIMGRPVETVLGMERDDNDGWVVTVQVVELARIPNSTDVLGAYVVHVDDDGEVVGYRRAKRYHRNQADED